MGFCYPEAVSLVSVGNPVDAPSGHSVLLASIARLSMVDNPTAKHYSNPALLKITPRSNR